MASLTEASDNPGMVGFLRERDRLEKMLFEEPFWQDWVTILNPMPVLGCVIPNLLFNKQASNNTISR
jgi:hypothetical protein